MLLSLTTISNGYFTSHIHQRHHLFKQNYGIYFHKIVCILFSFMLLERRKFENSFLNTLRNFISSVNETPQRIICLRITVTILHLFIIFYFCAFHPLISLRFKRCIIESNHFYIVTDNLMLIVIWFHFNDLTFVCDEIKRSFFNYS